MTQLDQAAAVLYAVCQKIAAIQEGVRKERCLAAIVSIKKELGSTAPRLVQRGMDSLKALRDTYNPLVPEDQANSFTAAYNRAKTAFTDYWSSVDGFTNHPSYGAGHQRFIKHLKIDDIEPPDPSSYDGYLDEPKF